MPSRTSRVRVCLSCRRGTSWRFHVLGRVSKCKYSTTVSFKNRSLSKPVAVYSFAAVEGPPRSKVGDTTFGEPIEEGYWTIRSGFLIWNYLTEVPGHPTTGGNIIHRARIFQAPKSVQICNLLTLGVDCHLCYHGVKFGDVMSLKFGINPFWVSHSFSAKFNCTDTVDSPVFRLEQYDLHAFHEAPL